jgi:hypothetical protein
MSKSVRDAMGGHRSRWIDASNGVGVMVKSPEGKRFAKRLRSKLLRQARKQDLHVIVEAEHQAYLDDLADLVECYDDYDTYYDDYLTTGGGYEDDDPWFEDYSEPFDSRYDDPWFDPEPYYHEYRVERCPCCGRVGLL